MTSDDVILALGLVIGALALLGPRPLRWVWAAALVCRGWLLDRKLHNEDASRGLTARRTAG